MKFIIKITFFKRFNLDFNNYNNFVLKLILKYFEIN